MWNFASFDKWLAVAGLFLGLVSAVGCGKKQPKMPDAYVAPELSGYFDDFIEDAKAHGVDVSSDSLHELRVIRLVDDIAAERRAYGQSPGNEALVGACTDVQVEDAYHAGVAKFGKGESKWQEVWIAREMADRLGHPTQDLVLRELVYHELGHCLLGLDHVASSPHHIMSPSVSSDVGFLKQNWQRLMSELFASARAAGNS